MFLLPRLVLLPVLASMRMQEAFGKGTFLGLCATAAVTFDAEQPNTGQPTSGGLPE
jgi:hypothetical protein